MKRTSLPVEKHLSDIVGLPGVEKANAVGQLYNSVLGVACMLLMMTAAPVNAQDANPQIREGNRAYREGDFKQSEISYRKALEKDPVSEKAGYNLANALYKQGQYSAAAEKLIQLSEKETRKEDQSRFHHNLGNAKYMNGQYAESIEAYKNALKLNPKDQDTRHNLLKAMQMLQKQQEQQQQNQQQNQSQNQQQPNQKPEQDQGDNKENDQQSNKDQKNGEKPGQTPEEKPADSNAGNNERQQISREDAERILKALENDEKAVFREVRDKQQQVQQVPVEKNW